MPVDELDRESKGTRDSERDMMGWCERRRTRDVRPERVASTFVQYLALFTRLIPGMDEFAFTSCEYVTRCSIQGDFRLIFLKLRAENVQIIQNAA